MPHFVQEHIHRRLSSSSAVLLTLLSCQVSTEFAGASVLPTPADIPAAESLGAAQNDTVWVRGQAVGTLYFSGTLIRGRDHDYVLTAAHGVKFPTGTFSPSQLMVGNGTSYIHNPGATSEVAVVYVSPTFVPGSNNGLDYAFLQLSNRISNNNQVFTIGATPQFGSSVLFSGFGIPGVMLGSTVPNNGNVMGFYGSYTPAGAWIGANDGGNFTGQNNSGYATGGDSGGAVKFYNLAAGRWENIGTIIGSDFSDSTIFLNYNNADAAFFDYLRNTVRPVVSAPKPPSLAIAANPTAVQLSFAHLIPSREYRVMRSPTLSGWQGAHRFTATTATYSWSEATSTEGKMFYRLEWDE
jgi:hypothetical protein